MNKTIIALGDETGQSLPKANIVLLFKRDLNTNKSFILSFPRSFSAQIPNIKYFINKIICIYYHHP